MKQSEEYINNLKELAFVLPCNLSNLNAGVPNLDELLYHCGFDNDYVTTIRKQIEAGVGESIILYVPSFIKDKEMINEFQKAFDVIIAREEFKKWKLKEHRNNLLLLILLLHDYYFLDAEGYPLYRIKYEKPFHRLSYEELPNTTQELMNGKEVADLLEILLQIKQTSNILHMQIGSSHALTTNKGLKSKIAESIESGLLNSTYDELGSGLALIPKYIEHLKTGNDADLKKSIKAIKSVQKKTFAPLLNKAIASFSLLVRNYLVNNGVPNTLPLWPNDLLKYIEELFVLLNVDYEQSPKSIRNLRRTLSGYIETHSYKQGEIVPHK